MSLIRFFLAFLLFAAPASAEPPRVVADIAPVHALVARVMDGIAEPDLLLQPGSTPHGFNLRPSQARALQNADLVVWVGTGLTPWLERPIGSLAADAIQLNLLDAATTIRLPLRETEGDATDPHIWLDPENARRWLEMIAGLLAEIDPDNAATYRANAAAGRAELDRLQAEVATVLKPVADRPFVNFHDAFQYFEARFGVESSGAAALSDASDPSPARIARLRATLAEQDITCAFSEPQFAPGLLEAAAEGRPLTVVELDPLGVGLETGPGLYTELLRNLARAFASCGG